MGKLLSPLQEGDKLMFLSEKHEFPSALCLAGKKLDDSSHLNVVETRVSLTFFRACFLPGLAKDLSAP